MINRLALIIRGKAPLFKWINEIEPTDPISEDSFSMGNSTIYLLGDDLDPDGLEEWLYNNYKGIFKAELFSWSTEESLYPNMTFLLFQNWFDTELIESVVDLGEDEIESDGEGDEES